VDIRFKLGYRRLARLDVYDVSGRRITKLTEDIYNGGWNSYLWNGIMENGRKVGSGVYLITLQSGEFKDWKKLIIVR
jgi:flagellar hook assembly protein FlgD